MTTKEELIQYGLRQYEAAGSQPDTTVESKLRHALGCTIDATRVDIDRPVADIEMDALQACAQALGVEPTGDSPQGMIHVIVAGVCAARAQIAAMAKQLEAELRAANDRADGLASALRKAEERADSEAERRRTAESERDEWRAIAGENHLAMVELAHTSAQWRLLFERCKKERRP